MAAPADEVHRVGAQCLDLQVVLRLQRAGLGDEEVDLASAKPHQQVVPVAHHGAQAHPRMARQEARQRLGDHGLRGIGAGADRHLARPVRLPAQRQVAVQVVGRGEQIAGALDQQAPFVGRRGARLGTLEERGADLRFHDLHAARQRRLGHAEDDGGAAEAAVVGHRHELPELTKVEGHGVDVMPSRHEKQRRRALDDCRLAKQ